MTRRTKSPAFSIDLIRQGEALAAAVAGRLPSAERLARRYLDGVAEQRQALASREGLVQEARDRYCSEGEVEIDDMPVLSVADAGVWVSGWMWVGQA